MKIQNKDIIYFIIQNKDQLKVGEDKSIVLVSMAIIAYSKLHKPLESDL